MRRIIALFASVFFLFTLFQTGAASAQIDRRIDHRVPGTDGHLLDRNPQIGSGGRNSSPFRFDGGRRSDAIVTRNVTGLAGFRGNSPVIATNQFRESLPSAGLSNFIGQSVGMPEVRSNQVLRPTFYYGTQETIADLGFIRSGLNRPGSSLLRTPLTRPPSSARLDVRDRLPRISDPTDRRMNVPRATPTLGIRQRELVPTQETTDLGRELFPLPFSSAANSSIFGIPEPPRLSRIESSRRLDERLVLPPMDEAIPREPASKSEPGIGRDDPGLAGPRSSWRDLAGVPDRRSQLAASGASTVTSKSNVTNPLAVGTSSWKVGQDRFTDLQNAARSAEKLGLRRLGFAGTQRDKAIVDLEANYRRRSDRTVVRPAPDKSIDELTASLRWTRNVLEDPVQSFVGQLDDALNKYLQAAETALHRGEYYAASDFFDLAHSADPDNPLPLLGRGHALAAAGDYISAAMMIEKGLRRFPQIAAFQMDLPSLVGQHDIFDIRRADLEKRLSASEHYELRFLLGYLELYSGLEEEGLKDLEIAAKHAPKSSIFSIFPDLVLGRRDLPPVKSSNP